MITESKKQEILKKMEDNPLCAIYFSNLNAKEVVALPNPKNYFNVLAALTPSLCVEAYLGSKKTYYNTSDFTRSRASLFEITTKFVSAWFLLKKEYLGDYGKVIVGDFSHTISERQAFAPMMEKLQDHGYLTIKTVQVFLPQNNNGLLRMLLNKGFTTEDIETVLEL